MNKKYTIWSMVAVVLIAIATMTTGCKKEKNASDEQKAPEGMLCFNNAEEFAETYKKVVAMTEEERRAWEQQQGFKSYATKCNELFEAFEAKGINSDEDIIGFVNENSDYFYIREEGGEKYLSSFLEDSPYRFLANDNQMFIINNKLFKLLKDGQIQTNISNYSSIKEISCIEEIGNNDEIELFSSNNSKSIVKKQYRATNGNQRTLAEVYINYSPAGVWEVVYLIRPYQRVLGIWYWARRTITGEMNTSWKYKRTSGDQWWYGSSEPFQQLEGRLDYCIEVVIGTLPYHNYSLYTAAFTRIDGWADTPSTDICYCILN